MDSETEDNVVTDGEDQVATSLPTTTPLVAVPLMAMVNMPSLYSQCDMGDLQNLYPFSSEVDIPEEIELPVEEVNGLSLMSDDDFANRGINNIARGRKGNPKVGADRKNHFSPGGAGGNDGGGGDPDVNNLTLESVGGLDDHIAFIRQSVMYPLKHQEAMQEWGVEPPKGIMFHGSPGTGKTLLAKAIGNEISKLTGKQVTFYYHKGSESFSKYVGESEANLRRLFAKAVATKPSIIFFDEIDGLCPNRERSANICHAYVGVVTAMLGLIDSVKRGDVLIIGATNRLADVDPAIRRPGRFDKVLFFPLPDEAGRKNIITIHTSQWLSDKPTGEFLTVLAKKTVGFTGADLKKLCTDTVQNAFTRNGDGKTIHVTEDDWATAFSQMNKSSTAVFGSSVYVADHVPPLLLPLFSAEMATLLPKLDLFLPDGQLAKTPGAGKLLNGPSSFLVWDSILVDDRYQLGLLMQNVLTHPRLSKYSTYILDVPTLAKLQASRRNVTITKLVGDLIGQIEQSESPCVLYIPQINKLYQTLFAVINQRKGKEENHQIPVFISQLKSIRGNKLILATWEGQMTNVFPQVKSLFNLEHGIYKLQKTGDAERRAFFKQLAPFSGKNEGPTENKRKKKGNNQNGSEAFNRLLEEIVEKTGGDPMRWVVNLFVNLSNRIDKKEDKNLITDLRNYLDRL